MNDLNDSSLIEQKSATSSLRHIRMDIHPHGQRYKAFLYRSNDRSDVKEVPLYFSVEDIHVASRELLGILERLVREYLVNYNGELSVSKSGQEFLQQGFTNLARQAHVAFERIFDGDGTEILDELISPASSAVLDISSEDFIFPWELLYEDYQHGVFSYDNFWGFKYTIYRNIPPKPGVEPPTPIVQRNDLAVGVLADNNLTHVKEIERPFLEKLENDRVIILLLLPCSLEANKKEALLSNEIKTFFQQKMQILHIACHTDIPRLVDESPDDEYCLLLSNLQRFSLCPSDIVRSHIRFDDWPLVILNACGTSPRNAKRTWSMVETFLRRGARGVVCTESTVPDSFAAAFAKQLYPLLLSGKELGDALFDTRLHFLKAPFFNPLGLLYSLYAFPHTKFLLTTYQGGF